jgi:hypothetical protein
MAPAELYYYTRSFLSRICFARLVRDVDPLKVPRRTDSERILFGIILSTCIINFGKVPYPADAPGFAAALQVQWVAKRWDPLTKK